MVFYLFKKFRVQYKMTPKPKLLQFIYNFIKFKNKINITGIKINLVLKLFYIL